MTWTEFERRLKALGIPDEDLYSPGEMDALPLALRNLVDTVLEEPDEFCEGLLQQCRDHPEFLEPLTPRFWFLMLGILREIPGSKAVPVLVELSVFSSLPGDYLVGKCVQGPEAFRAVADGLCHPNHRAALNCARALYMTRMRGNSKYIDGQYVRSKIPCMNRGTLGRSVAIFMVGFALGVPDAADDIDSLRLPEDTG